MKRIIPSIPPEPPRTPALRALPPVHRIITALGETDLPRPTVLAAVRQHLDALRRRLAADVAASAPGEAEVIAAIRLALDHLRRRRIAPVINATGIIVHTNLGRAPLSRRAAKAVLRASREYSNLEFDLVEGHRGQRAAYLENNLALLCGAEGATAVNNCAAAVVLALHHFASGPPRVNVLVSRGELVQIGGGFRVPEILEASGATLREVGTTNKTTLADYRRAIDERTALILRVHRSNFYMGGFVESPGTRELAQLAREAKVPLVEDLGSGAMFDTGTLGGGEHEPVPENVIADGADLVCFSGDKLLGGPQAGIIAGRAVHVAVLKQDPLFRALRCGKLVLSALEPTIDALLDRRVDDLPARAMMNLPLAPLRQRAERIVTALTKAGIAARIGAGASQIGGGSLPRTELPSVTIDVTHREPQALAARLRNGTPPVIGYVAQDRLKLDVRTVFPRQDARLIHALVAALS